MRVEVVEVAVEVLVEVGAGVVVRRVVHLGVVVSLQRYVDTSFEFRAPRARCVLTLFRPATFLPPKTEYSDRRLE